MPAAVLVAVALDALVGEPPARLHPVVATGRYLDRAAAVVPSAPPVRAVLLGGLCWAGGLVGAVAAGAAVEQLAGTLPRPARPWLRGLALWPLLSARLLLEEVRAVEDALARDLDEGRTAVSRIVSRDTTALSGPQVRAAAIESLAENLSDSVVAPLLWYGVGGLPAAAGYRYANTADAMWGYRSPRWEHAGKVAARADDLLNLVPARVTAALLRGVRAPFGRRRLRAEAARTPSPNAGWPMAAAALRLDLRLAKPDTYVLNPRGRTPTPGDTDAALRVARRAAAGAAALAVLLRLTTQPDRPRGDR